VSGYEEEIVRLVAQHPHCRAEVTPAEILCARGGPRSRPLTAHAILAMRPCGTWPADRVRDLICGRTVSLADLLRCESVPVVDRLWVACQPGAWARPKVVLRWLAGDYAAAALPRYEVAHADDWRPRRSIEAARLYSLGLIRGEILAAAERAAWSAAMSASRSAARSAARSASESASWSASESAAWSASWSASESAADSAAMSAAWSSAWSEQVARVLSLLEARP